MALEKSTGTDRGHPIVLLSIYFIIIFKYYNYRHLYHSIILGRTSPYSL